MRLSDDPRAYIRSFRLRKFPYNIRGNSQTSQQNRVKYRRERVLQECEYSVYINVVVEPYVCVRTIVLLISRPRLQGPIIVCTDVLHFLVCFYVPGECLGLHHIPLSRALLKARICERLCLWAHCQGLSIYSLHKYSVRYNLNIQNC